MKAIKFLFSSLILGQVLNAQITVTSSNMPVVNDTIRYSTASLSSLGNYTASGANHIWDFSLLSPTGQGFRKFQSGLVTPYAFYFFYPKYGEKTQDSVGFSSYKFKNIYTFYKKTSSIFSGEGVGFSFSGVPLAGTYSDEDELYQFPLNYLDRDSSTFKFKVNLPSSVGSYGKQGYRINEVDGWGTITTPYGTASCLRLISTQYSIDSIGTPLGNLGFPNYIRSYQWVTSTEKIPFLEVSGPLVGSNFTPAQVRYRDVLRTFVGVKEEQLNLLLTAFPNPSQNELTIIMAKTDESVLSEIADLQGKTVKTVVLDNNTDMVNQHKIDVSTLAKGLYILTISTKNGKQSLKISIQ